MDVTLRKKLILTLWLGIFVIGFGSTLIGIGREGLWYDETFTGAAVRHSMGELIPILAGDNHPPLYFVALKLYSLVFGTGEGELRSFSALGLLAFALLGYFGVRRLAGNGAGIAFAVLAFLLPINHQMAQEARNYTWVAFFTTAAMLYGLLALREGKVRDWVLFGVFALASCYTHNFGLFTAVMIIAVLFVYALFTDRKKALRVFLVGASVAVLYLPWFFVLLQQAAKVSGDYWIPPVTSDTMWGAVFYPFAYKFEFQGLLPNYSAYAMYFMVVILASGIIYSIKKRTIKLSTVLLPLAAWFLMLVFAFVASALFRPIFVLRYSMAFTGLFLLAFCFVLSGFKQLPFTAAVLAIVAIFAVQHLIGQHGFQFNGPMREVRAKLVADTDPATLKEAAFICNNEHAFGCFSYYFPENPVFLVLDDEVFKGYSNYQAFAPLGQTGPDFTEFVKGRKTVFTVDYNPEWMPKVPWYSGGEGSGWTYGPSFVLPEPISFAASGMDEDYKAPTVNLWYNFRVSRYDAEPAGR